MYTVRRFRDQTSVSSPYLEYIKKNKSLGNLNWLLDLQLCIRLSEGDNSILWNW